MSEYPAEEPAFSEDRLLGGRIRLKQPAAGYRVAIDPVFLAAAVPVIHRADRIDALLGQIAGRAGEVVVFPLWPGQGRAASRILVRVRKQVAAPARLAAGLVLHDPEGRLSAGAEGVLREGRGLEL